jgi:DNA (cytosine-5)-methyltransferase 1
MKPRALDLFCCAGGASVGLERAGFDVVGVDIEFHKNYPGPMIVIDALKIEQVLALSDFDLIWASPPCQRWSKATPKRCRANHPDLIQPIRDLLARSGALTVIENVSAAPIRPDIILDGVHFGLPLERRRIFEVNFETDALRVGPRSRPAAGPNHGELTRPSLSLGGRPDIGPEIEPQSGPESQGQSGRIYRPQLGLPKAVCVTGGGGPGKGSLDEWKSAMGINWMNRRELVEAVPPAYAEAIGRCAISQINQFSPRGCWNPSGVCRQAGEAGLPVSSACSRIFTPADKTCCSTVTAQAVAE